MLTERKLKQKKPKEMFHLFHQSRNRKDAKFGFVFASSLAGWYEGERLRDEMIGWFPSSHCEEIDNEHSRVRNLRQRYRLLTASRRNILTPIRGDKSPKKVKSPIRRRLAWFAWVSLHGWHPAKFFYFLCLIAAVHLCICVFVEISTAAAAVDIFSFSLSFVFFFFFFFFFFFLKQRSIEYVSQFKPKTSSYGICNWPPTSFLFFPVSFHIEHNFRYFSQLQYFFSIQFCHSHYLCCINHIIIVIKI